jgi:TolB-like protein
MKKLTTLLILFFLFVSLSFAQVKIAVLPFQNMDGLLDYNVYSYKLQDSVYKALKALDPDGKYYQLVPLEEIEVLLADMNLDPTNPQYPTDMWKAAEELGAQKVVTGNFSVESERFLISAYVYDVDTKLPNLSHQARDIFKKEKDILKAVRIIIKRLKPILITN